MAADAGQPVVGAGLLDLEKELSCSICTDVLYQPLTLLDCLHTFCGSCVKEWFSWQRARASSSNPNPYTCPSCRASVRGTKHNATVNTLLDMFLQANPGRAKTDDEREQIARSYKPGDEVMPRVRVHAGQAEESDRRLLRDVQQMSLREVGISDPNARLLNPPRDRRRREGSREARSREGRPRRHGEDGRSPGRDASSASARADLAGSRNEAQRQVEHQSSLRSLLSASEIDSQEIEEEIMRQILEEGLLDGIDLNNITVEREDEISERIAQAYRRRQRERRQAREAARRGQQQASAVTSPPSDREDNDTGRRRVEQSERLPAPSTHQSSRSPSSQSHSRDVSDGRHRRHHQRSVSQGNGQALSPLLAPADTRPATRSALDLSEPPTTTATTSDVGTTRTGRRRPRRLSQHDRSITDPERPSVSEQWRTAALGGTTSNPNSPRRAAFQATERTQQPSSSASTPTDRDRPAGRRRTDPTASFTSRANEVAAAANTESIAAEPETQSPPWIAHSSTDPAAPASVRTTRNGLYSEPRVICNRCGKDHIEYELHYNCPKCEGGNYHLCLRCYRQGKGCLHWFGFGYAAWTRYEKRAPPGGYPPNHERPHVLAGNRYQRPSAEITRGSITVNQPTQLSTDEDPASRLEKGAFCALCHAFASSCYWKCDFCNEGEWGFCNDCVNQGRHCTHPLLPLTEDASSPAAASTTSRNDTTPSPRADGANPAQVPSNDFLRPSTPSQDATPTTPPLTPRSASLLRGATHLTPLANTFFRPLTFTTCCDICHYPIPPSHTRFHCTRCNSGDYDICAPCYHNLVTAGRIAPENGANGWRRCLRGHRMVVIGFEDRDGGQYRIVPHDLVGGLGLRDEDGADSQAARPIGSNANVFVMPNWSWRETDGTVRRARAATATNAGNVAAPPSSSPPSTKSTSFPPDGGIGLRVLAQWSYYPSEGVKDELMFPKGAEIREAEDINGDWLWGVYAGSKGLFPGNYGRVL